MKNIKDKIISISIMVVLIIIDLSIKNIVQDTLQVGQQKTIIDGFFYITSIHNNGAAFSILEGSMIFFYIISAIALGTFIKYSKMLDFKNNKLFSISTSLIVGGLLGNLIDRITLKYVRDMFDFIIFGYDFAVFNFADMCLVIGTILLVIYLLKEEENE